MSPLSSSKTEAVSSAELRAVLDHAQVGVCVLDARDLRARWCNAAFRRFVSEPFRTRGVAGRHASEFVPRYAKDLYQQVFDLVAETGRPFVNPEDEHIEAKGGPTYWRWSLTAIPAAAGDKREAGSSPTLMLQAVDVTQQVAARRYAAAAAEAESAARDHAARLEAILDSTDEGILIADPSGAVVHMNPAARRIHGYGPEDEPGRHFADFVRVFELRHAGDGRVLTAEEWPLARAMRGEQFSGYELIVRRVDVAHEVIASYNGGSVVPHGGNGAGQANVVIVGVRDITGQKQAEHELHRARQQAESASHAKDQFLAVLSHELRTPLTPVLTAAQAMENDPQVPDSFRATAAMIRRNVELEARLIDDLLDLTRISRGKLRLDFTRTDAHEQVLSVVQILEHDARSKGVLLDVSLTSQRHYVRADPARLQQVVWNLLKNAIKFTPEFGRVTVSTSETSNGQILIEVIDTGIGIDPGVLPMIFDAFQQGSGEVTQQFGGLGLGLAITRVLVQLHGGSITAHSAGPGRGARFAVALPLVPEPSRGRAAASAALAAADKAAFGSSGLVYSAGSGLANVVGSGLANMTGSAFDGIGSSGLVSGAADEAARRQQRRRILLVEDHEDTAHVMTMVLRHSGHDVRRAATVAAALQAAQAESFDLLISDIGLPDGSGLDLMRQLRLRQPVRGIALSGFGMDEDVKRSRAAGFDEHLTKPVTLDVLEHTIKRVIES